MTFTREEEETMELRAAFVQACPGPPSFSPCFALLVTCQSDRQFLSCQL